MSELQYALDRMSTPLDPSRLSGATADEDARCMGIIRAELDRLRECLNAANASTEHFEREWYLRGDENEALRAERDALFHARQAAFERAAQQCEIVAHNAMDVGYAQVCADCAREIRRIAQHERDKEIFGDD